MSPETYRFLDLGVSFRVDEAFYKTIELRSRQASLRNLISADIVYCGTDDVYTFPLEPLVEGVLNIIFASVGADPRRKCAISAKFLLVSRYCLLSQSFCPIVRTTSLNLTKTVFYPQ